MFTFFGSVGNPVAGVGLLGGTYDVPITPQYSPARDGGGDGGLCRGFHCIQRDAAANGGYYLSAVETGIKNPLYECTGDKFSE